jgi:hypothetical protein
VTTVLAASSIFFTSVPPYGSFNDLHGIVHGVNPANYRVAVFINVNGAGWFTKPTCAAPLTMIQPDGTWTADITTGGSDQDAIQIAAYVVPANFNQPCVTNVFCIPDAVGQPAIANTLVTRLDPATRGFHWSGYDWRVKASTYPVGPGPNYFSDSTNNVAIDAQGRLHLRITHVAGLWQCAEIVLQRTLGYGTYAYHIASPVDALDQNLVLGLFTWSDQPAYTNREMDFEGGRWSYPGDYQNAQFVRQPYYLPGYLVRYRIPPLATNSIPSMNWQTNAITFLCSTGTTAVVAIPTNALLNPGFELGSGSIASNWTQFGSVYRTSTNEIASPFIALAGAYSLKMFGPFNPAPGASGAYQNLAGASPGQTWRLTGFALNWSGDPMTQAGGYGVAQLIFLDAGNNQLQVNGSQHFDPTTQQDAWQYFQVTATAPAGTTAVRVQLLHVGQAGISGSVWWDSVSAAVTPDTRSIAQWTFTRDVPPSCDENVDWNLWLIDGYTNTPANGLEAEIIMDRFEFIPNDTDGDRMPDEWELAHGLNPNDPTDANRDDDGDGFTNLQEYLAGTDPADPASAFEIAEIDFVGANARVTFPSVLDKSYLLETAGSLPSTNWSTVTQNVAGTGSLLQIVDPSSATNTPRGFFRIRLVP